MMWKPKKTLKTRNFREKLESATHYDPVLETVFTLYNMNDTHFSFICFWVCGNSVKCLAGFLAVGHGYLWHSGNSCMETDACRTPRTSGCRLKGLAAWSRVFSSLLRAELSEAQWKIHNERQLILLWRILLLWLQNSKPLKWQTSV